MIYAVTVTNHVGESLRCDLANPEQSGFAITRIEGIGPGSSTINITDVATMDGGFYNSSRLSSRNITLSIVFTDPPRPNPTYTKVYGVESSRHLSYRFFPLKKPIRLTFETDERVCEIEGYVESNEPDIFNKQESTQISILCPNPYFKLVTHSEYIRTVIASRGLFEFPFQNPSLTAKRIIFGNAVGNNRRFVQYDGDIEAGVLLHIIANDSLSDIYIYYEGIEEDHSGVPSSENPFDYTHVIKIDNARLQALTGSPIQAGDEIVISTIKGSKYAWLIREGVTYNILGCLGDNPYWFQLEKGNNIFLTQISSGILSSTIYLEHQTLFLGV